MVPHRLNRTGLFIGLALALWLTIAPCLSVQAATPIPPSGTYYLVQRGDSWSLIAWRNGLTVAQLRAANPGLQRPGDTLYPGDRVFIPAPGGAASQNLPLDTEQAPAGPGYWYILKAGDTWQSIARDTGVGILDLYHANPALVARDRYLYPGTRVWIPGAQPAEPEVTAAPSSDQPATPEATTVPSANQPAMPEATTAPPPNQPATPEATTAPSPGQPAAPEPTAIPTAAPLPTATPASAAVAGCPDGFAAYPAAITAYLNSPGATTAGLRTLLARCGAINQLLGGVTEGHIQGPNSDDVVVVLYDPSDRRLVPAARLLVYHDSPEGYVLAGVAQGDGRIAVLKVDDVNADGQTDIVWTDTTCNATACYSTLFVDSWTGTSYRSYIDGQPTTANADYSFQPVPGSPAQAIIVTSGSGPNAGQPATYLSTGGGAYRLAGQDRTGLASAATAAMPTAQVTSVPPTPTPAAPTVTPVPTVQVTYAPPTPAPALPTAMSAPTVTTAPPTPLPTAPPTALPTPASQPTLGAPVAPTSGAMAAPQPTQEPPPTPAAGGCLYDRVRAANQAFDAWMAQGFANSITAYQDIIADTTSRACGSSPDELALLRDFARFRLIVASVASGSGGTASGTRAQMTMPALQGAADAFINSYRDSRSIIQACRDANAYAGTHPDAWHFLVDLGSKDFTAADMCTLDR